MFTHYIKQTNKQMDVYRLNLYTGMNSNAITTPWFSGGHNDTTFLPAIHQHNNNGWKLAGKRNRYRSIAHFLKHWLKRECIYEEMKATNKEELKYSRHILVLNIEKKNQENDNPARWTSFQIRGKLNSKKSFYKSVSRSVESILAYRSIAMGN